MTDETNPQLTTKQKLLLKFHYKLGHLGFQHLKFVIRNFELFGTQGMMAIDKETEVHICSSCVTRGMQKNTIAPGMKKHTQKHEKRGILKREQLQRG